MFTNTALQTQHRYDYKHCIHTECLLNTAQVYLQNTEGSLQNTALIVYKHCLGVFRIHCVGVFTHNSCLGMFKILGALICLNNAQ